VFLFFLDEPANGRMAERGGMLKVFVKGRKKDEPGRWESMCEFSMTVVSHAMNKIQGRSRCFIFRCVVSNGDENETFYVPLARDDCDEFPHLFAVFKARKKGCGAFIHKDNCSKNSRLINWCRSLMTEYETGAVARKKGSLVADKKGLVTATLDDGRSGSIFIVGPHCALPVSMNLTNSDVNKVDIIWIGSAESEDIRVPTVEHAGPQQDLRKLWVEALSVYYAINKGSLFALFGQLFLNMNMKDLVRHGFKLASAQIIGEMGSGKSDLAGHIQSIFPRRYHQGNYTQVNDRKMSATLLSQETAKTRPFNIQG
jgi:hypothetical protein